MTQEINSKLPKNTNLEMIDGAKLYDGLKKATKNIQKGEYGKGQHSFKILTCLDGNNLELIPHSELDSESFTDYDAVVLAVAHNEFKELKPKTDTNVVFDIKSVLDETDGRL